MKPSSFGFTWHPRTGPIPALLIAWRVVRPRAGVGLQLKHALWALDYSFEVAGSFRVGSRARPWQPRLANEAHLYPPGTRYWERYPDRPDPIASAYILFRGGEACGLTRWVRPPICYVRFLDPAGTLGSLLEQIARTGQQDGESSYWHAQGLLCDVVNLLHHSEPVENETRRIRNPAPTEPPSSFAGRADAFLANHLADHVTLASLARYLNISESQLSHRYRRETGETPMSRLEGMRIDLAKGLLMRGLPLKAIAEATGFYDAFHLSHAFKKIAGLSPRAFLTAINT